MGEELCNILKVADKHPKSRMAKLIHIVQEEPNEKNITMLIIEMAEHNEYSVDFNLSLKYYIDLFERQCLGHDIIFNEAGLFLANSSKIYARRVDWVQSRVEQQILSLSNSEKELEKESNEQESDENVKATEADKSCTKRGRKRVLEVSTNEVEGSIKKIHKLMPDKRFSSPDIQSSLNSSQSKLDAYARLEMEQHLHPLSSLHGTIYDLVNDRDIYKRNYKMFAYHVDHRYNTLVPDINFHLHFKIKDFIDEEDEACHTERRQWPPLSKAYIKQYTELEDRILGQTLSRKMTVQNAKHSSNLTSSEVRETEESAINSIGCVSRGESSPLSLSGTQNEIEALSGTLNESSVQITDKDISTEQTANASSTLTHSQNESSESEGYQSLNNSLDDKSQRNDSDVSKNQENDKMQNHSKDRSEDLVGEKIDLGGIRVHLPHLDDEGVCFSDLDEIDQKMLSPKVVATDILPCVPNKESITIVIDEEIRSLLRIERDTTETTPSPSPPPPPPNTPAPPQITLNICKLPERLIRKRAFFKLGPEMDLHMKARFFKRLRLSNEAIIRQRRQLQRFPLNDTDPTNVQITPCSSPDFCGFSDYNDSEDEIDMNFLGFDESEKERDGCSNDSIHRLSRDSGVGVEGSVTAQHNSSTLGDSSLSELNKQKKCDSQIDSVGIDNPPGDNTSNSTLGDSANPENVVMVNSMGHDHDTDNDTDNTKVQEWYDYLRPILATSQERHHFDVFHLGTEIIETIQNNSENKNIEEQQHHPEHNVKKSAHSTPAAASFMEIMQNRDESHVSRYFLATLLLINQNNLKLSVEDGRKNGEKPIDWEDMHLELQSTTRHTVAIEDNIGLLGKQDNTSDRQLEGAEEKQQTDKLHKHSSKGDSNATYCKNLSMKKAFKESTNTSNSNSEAPINNSQSNENITTSGLIASTPLHKPGTSASCNSEFNVNWHAPRISDIMPLRLNMESMEEADESENELNRNSNHSYHHFNDPPCTSKQMIEMNERQSLPPVRLKFIKPLPAIQKTHQQNETDSGIFSTDDYQSMS